MESTSAINILAADRVLQLPELIKLIGQQLENKDLLSCIQVTQAWSNIFIPLLWRTFNTCQWQRPKIDKYYEAILRPATTATSTTATTDVCLKSVFRKYGHHIRHLKTQYKGIVAIAYLNDNCTNLVTLSIPEINGNDEERYTKATTPSTSVLATFFDPPQLPWVSQKDTMYWEDRIDTRHITEKIWLLLRQNPRLNHFHLCRGFKSAFIRLPVDFLIGTISSMKCLKELHMYCSLVLDNLFEAAPNLQLLMTEYLTYQPCLQKRYSSLSQLVLFENIEIYDLLEILDRLPGLTILHTIRINPNSDEMSLRLSASTESYISLKEIWIGIVGSQSDDAISTLVRRCPCLTKVWMPHIFEMTKYALWENCYNLDEIKPAKTPTILAWRMRRSGEFDF